MDNYNLRDEEVTINLKLLKLFRFYHMIKPNSTKIFNYNYNAYRLLIFLYVAIMNSIVIFSITGFFVDTDDSQNISYVDLFLIMFLMTNFFFCSWRICIILIKSNTIFEVLNVSRLNFFTSEHCRKHLNALFKNRDQTIKITYYFFVFSTIVIVQWLISPIMAIMFTTTDVENCRLPNILNLRFPVSTHTYNQYHLIFYLMEVTISILPSYVIILTDILILSFSLAIIAQQEVLSRAFKNIGHEENSQSKCYDDFKSILGDQIQLNLKIKSYYSIVKPVILANVAMSSTFLVITTYVFIVVLFSNESYEIFIIIKLGSTAFFIPAQFFLYCYLLDNMNHKRESVNFAIYSCNWTKMDVKFKMLLLLTLRMNDANTLMIKVSPKKVVNLQMLTSVISTSYNIISVMLKTTNLK